MEEFEKRATGFLGKAFDSLESDLEHWLTDSRATMLEREMGRAAYHEVAQARKTAELAIKLKQQRLEGKFLINDCDSCEVCNGNAHFLCPNYCPQGVV